MSKFSISINEAIDQLKKETDKKFTVLINNCTMSIEYYAPEKIDGQSPHLQDEIYVIASGHTQFYRDGETVECEKGDVLFVPAGMEHRFVNFSNDFATWVIFYGPEGGEKSSL
jgi:mannose-6-phosphate isomerase-like protein (cupin superfamily)